MVTPILVTQYKCDKCGQRYFDLGDAADCEDRHFTLSDFEILDLSKEKTPYSGFPRSIHVANQKTDKIASYIFNHDNAKPKSVSSNYERWHKMDDYYKKPYALFPGEEEDE